MLFWVLWEKPKTASRASDMPGLEILYFDLGSSLGSALLSENPLVRKLAL